MTAPRFGNVERAVIEYLDALLAAPVGDRVPEGDPLAHVPNLVVVRLGGPRVSVVTEQATITVEARGATKVEAFDLCADARQLVHQLEGRRTGGLTFYGIREFAGPAPLPDPESGLPRYTFTVSMTVRAAA